MLSCSISKVSIFIRSISAEPAICTGAGFLRAFENGAVLSSKLASDDH
jgi:hypothetical protein